MFTMNEVLCIFKNYFTCIIFKSCQQSTSELINCKIHKFYCFQLFSNFSIIHCHNQSMYAYRCKTYAYAHIQLKVTIHVHSACVKIYFLLLTSFVKIYFYLLLSWSKGSCKSMLVYVCYLLSLSCVYVSTKICYRGKNKSSV